MFDSLTRSDGSFVNIERANNDLVPFLRSVMTNGLVNKPEIMINDELHDVVYVALRSGLIKESWESTFCQRFEITKLGVSYVKNNR